MRNIQLNSARVLLMTLVFISGMGIKPGSADFYKYTDKTGMMQMTNDLEAVPKEYRAKAIVIKEEIKKPDAPGATALPALPAQSAEELNIEMSNYLKAQEQKRAVAQQLAPEAEKKPTSWEIVQKYVISVLVVFAFLSLFIYMGKLCEVLRVRQFASVLRLLMFSMLIVYVYQLGVQRMTATFVGLKKDALAIKANIEGRENRTDQILEGTAAQEPKQNQ